jgi:hypothetical protein
VSSTNRPTTYREHGSKAEQLHRHGVNCMDVIERDECAIDYFEQLVALDPTHERELLSDAMFRLVALYRRSDRRADATLLLRKFWDVGTSSGSAGIVPWSTRFLGPEMSVAYMVDMDRLSQTPLFRGFSPELHDVMFTCDKARREQLEKEIAARREERRKAREATMSEEERRKDAARRQRFSSSRRRNEGLADPIHSAAICDVARVMGLEDPRGFTRWVALNDHRDPSKSAAVFQVAGLPDRIASAVSAGTITPEGERTYSIVDVEYQGAKVMLLHLDVKDLVLVPEKAVGAVTTAFEAREDTLDPEISNLIDKIPKGVVFFTIFDKQAMVDGVESMGTIGRLLPEPEGLLIAAVVYGWAGVFIRMPTENAVRASMLLGLARLLLQRAEAEAAEDSTMARIMEEMDISQTPDGKALMMSTILSPENVEAMFLD